MLRLLLTLLSVAWAWADDIITADDENTPVVDIISQHLGTVGPPDPKRVKRSMMMSRAAAEAWANVVLDAPNGTRYFEWGSGGSTEAAAYAARGRRGPVFSTPGDRVLQVVSVDSSEAWFDELRRDSELIRLAELEGRLSFVYADVGETEEFGNPADWETTSPGEQAKKAKTYVEAPIDNAGGDFDVVLVDGRWRLACGLSALRHLTSSAIVMVHDYFDKDLGTPSGRDGYSDLLSWYDVVGQARELVILKPKAEALEQARAATQSYTQALESAYHKKEMAAARTLLAPRKPSGRTGRLCAHCS